MHIPCMSGARWAPRCRYHRRSHLELTPPLQTVPTGRGDTLLEPGRTHGARALLASQPPPPPKRSPRKPPPTPTLARRPPPTLKRPPPRARHTGSPRLPASNLRHPGQWPQFAKWTSLRRPLCTRATTAASPMWAPLRSKRSWTAPSALQSNASTVLVHRICSTPCHLLRLSRPAPPLVLLCAGLQCPFPDLPGLLGPTAPMVK